MDLGLKGKSVLITGGSMGIGRATAWAFAKEGAATIHLTARTVVLGFNGRGQFCQQVR